MPSAAHGRSSAFATGGDKISRAGYPGKFFGYGSVEGIK